MNLTLPSIAFKLPEWHESQFKQFKTAEKQLAKLASSAGTNSDKFNDTIYRLMNLVVKQKVFDPAKLLTSAIDVRAFTYLLSTNNSFAEALTLSSKTFERIRAIRRPMSRLSLTQMIRAYLVYFDLYVNNQMLMVWSKFIQDELSTLSSRDTSGANQLQVYKDNKHLIFLPSAPAVLTRKAIKESVDLDRLLEKLSLTGYSDSRFFQICQYHYYLETLKSIAKGQDHPILAEVVKSNVVNCPYDNTKLLGHAILEILIDRSEHAYISPAWQRVVLEIAGDPRVPQTSSRYLQWWSLLGDERIAKVRGWLSSFDLKLFLETLEQSAKESRNTDMERMFGDRKVFMEGLLKQGLVTNSRLFLSRAAESFLKSAYKKEELPEYARVDSRDTSMIYLNLAGRIHMIEGSHSFQIKFMDKLPEKLYVANYSKARFSDSELRTLAKSHYYKQFGDDGGYVEFPHQGFLNWQHKAISYLQEHNIKLEISRLIPKDKYRSYKEKFGI